MESELDTKSPLKNILVQPENINYGCLKPGENATATLRVSGGSGKVVVNSDHLKVTPLSFSAENNELQVVLLAGSAGELIWDSITLQSETNEVKVPVTARWEEHLLQISTGSEERLPQSSDKQSEARELDLTRTFKGKSCARCGKNFAYDINTGAWEQCSCTWYQKLVNMSSYRTKELRLGIKDLPSIFKETWQVLFGKEKW